MMLLSPRPRKKHTRFVASQLEQHIEVVELSVDTHHVKASGPRGPLYVEVGMGGLL